MQHFPHFPSEDPAIPHDKYGRQLPTQQEMNDYVNRNLSPSKAQHIQALIDVSGDATRQLMKALERREMPTEYQ